MRQKELHIDYNTFGGRLYKEIEKKFGSRYAFEKATGLCRETILNYIGNRRHPTTITLVMMCEKLDCSADYLLFGEKRQRK